MKGISLGFENLNDEEAPEIVEIDMEAALQSGIDAAAAIDEWEGNCESLHQILEGLENLTQLQSIVETHGVEASLVVMFRDDLKIVAPSTESIELDKIAEVDTDKVSTELTASMEKFGAKVVQIIKNLIAKIVEFLKKLFTNYEKMAKQIDALASEAKKADKKDDAIGVVSVLGVSKKRAEACIAARGKNTGYEFSQAYAAGKSAEECIKIVNDASELFGFTVDAKLAMKPIEGTARASKSIKDLGFTKSDIVGMAGKISGAIADLKKLGENEKKALEKYAELAQDEEKAKGLAWPPATVASFQTKWFNFGAKELAGLAMQEIAMLKACLGKAEAAKEPKAGE